MKTTALRTLVLPLVALAAISAPACAADATSPAASATPAATVGGVAEPAVNASFLARCSDMSAKLMGEAKGALDNAKSAGSALGGFGSFGGVGAKASATADKAQAALDKATGLKSDIDALRAGKPISSTGVFASLTGGASSGGTSLADTFKGLPMAPVVQNVLGNADTAKSLLAGLPVDKVPGYATATAALTKAGL